MPAVTKGTILVTGVTGYIAAWTAQILLDQGYKVKGTVRDQAKAQELKDRFAKHGDNFQLVTVADLQQENAFADAIKGVDGVLHVASPFHFNVKDGHELIGPAVEGTTTLLKAAAQEQSVKRVVVTSSFAAMMQHYDVDHEFSEKDWNETSSQIMKEKNYKIEGGTDGMHAYLASKTEAERSAWDFVEKQKPQFDLAVINPVYVFGPFIHPVKNAESINTSVGMILSLLKGGDIGQEQPHTNWVDVRDVAQAHVNALSTEAAGGHRFILSAGPFGNGQMAGILKKKYPKVQTPKTEEVPSFGQTIKSDKAQKELHIKYVTLEQSLADTAKDLERFI